MKYYNRREFECILTQNGYTCTRQNGDHAIWQKGGDSIAVPKHKLNFMICKRLIKEHNLEV